MKLVKSTYVWFRVLRKLRVADYRNFSIKKTSSYVFQNGSLPLCDLTISELLDNAADTYGDHTALIFEHQGISKNCSEIRKETEKLASGFLASGLQKGDKIGIYSPNCYEWLLTQLAAAKAGLVMASINYACTPKELEYCLQKVKCKAVLSYDKLKHQDFYETLNKIIPTLKESRAERIKSDKFPALEKVIMISDENNEGTMRFKDVMESGNRESDIALSKIQKKIQFDDITHILFTSGTTGLPKAALITNHKTVNNLSQMFSFLEYDKMEPVICCPVPLFHLFGCHIGSLAFIFNKSTAIFPSATYDTTKSLECIAKYKCNVAYGTPTMLIDLLRKSKECQMDISTIKNVVTGASFVPESLLRNIHSSLKEPNINVLYGLTESCGILARAKFCTDFKASTNGFLKPNDLTELKIIDKKGFVASKHVVGELCSRGYSTFLGYSDDGKKTSETIDEHGWLHTGDIGIMNDDGWVKIVGRIKDIVIRGGENILLTEVESFLSTHPAILQVNLCGVPDERLGEELCCWISVKPDEILTEEDVREFCKGKISHYKIPRYILFVDEFPTTVSGKIKRFEMTEMSIKKLNLQSNQETSCAHQTTYF